MIVRGGRRSGVFSAQGVLSTTVGGSRTGVSTVVGAWLTGRAVFVVGWLLARWTWGVWSDVRPLQLDQGLLAWDGSWYRDLVVNGYGATAGAIRFFPGFPLMGRALGFLPGGPAAALVLIANLSFLPALALVRRFTEFLTGDPAVARRAVWLVALWPASFVSVMAYSEPPAMVLVLLTLIAVYRGRPAWAGAAALAAAVVRPTGVLLVVPLGLMAARRWARENRSSTVAGDAAAMWLVSAAPLGAATFALWSSRSGYGFWGPVSAQRPLRGGFHEPLSRVLAALGDLLVTDRLGDGLHAPFAVVMLGLVVLGWFVLPRPLAWYGAAVAAVALGAGNLNSLERYFLAAPTLLMGAAMLPWTRRVFAVTMTVSATAGVGLTTLAYLGRYVP